MYRKLTPFERGEYALTVLLLLTGVAGPASWAQPPPDPVAAATPVATVAAPQPGSGDWLAWWMDPASNPTFRVEFVGQAAGQRTLVVRFSRAVDGPATLSRFIHVLGEDGKPVAGEWQAGGVGSVVALAGLAPGRYTVIIDPRVASTQNDPLGAMLNGTIVVQ